MRERLFNKPKEAGAKNHQRILFLTKYPELIQKQLNQDLEAKHQVNKTDLADNVDTDAIFPTQFLGKDPADAALRGFPGIDSPIGQSRLTPNVLVAGKNFGTGSAREYAPRALKKSLGPSPIILALSFDPRFRRNCTNIGILTCDDPKIVNQVIKGEQISREKVLATLPPLQKLILEQGGIIAFLKAYKQGSVKIPPLSKQIRPLTMLGKIIQGKVGDDFYPQAGDIVVLSPDIVAFYDLYTKAIFKTLERYGLKIDPETKERIRAFSDHGVQSPNPKIQSLVRQHLEIAEKHEIELYPCSLPSEANKRTSTGISHPLLRELILQPGSILLITDSHAATSGAVGVLGLQSAITEMAGAMATGKCVLEIPETVRVKVEGFLKPGVSTKDVIVYLLAEHPDFFSGKCVEFYGEGLESFWPDQTAVLANMSKEGGAVTSLVEPTARVIEILSKLTNISRSDIQEKMDQLKTDANADCPEIVIQLQEIPIMVAEPGSPLNGVPLKEIKSRPQIQKAYIGSCTGGNWYDILTAAEILQYHHIAENVQLLIQPATISIYQAMCEAGLNEIFEKAGAVILPPACGACGGLGPGGPQLDEICVSSSNRNFPGRMGPGETYLASVETTIASAVEGYLCSVNEI